MVWTTHWQCCFKSRKGNDYAVRIYDQDYDGSIVDIIGSANPFETQEDDNEDIFTPVRIQTGYFRFLDSNGSLMEEIIPSNNTERMIQLLRGTYRNGSFVGNVICWQGFLQARAYTQPWEENSNIVEIPVVSVLGALMDVQLLETDAPIEGNVAKLLITALSRLGLRDDADITGLTVCTDANDGMNTLLKPLLQWSLFFSSETIHNEGDSEDVLIGTSFYNALSAVMSLYGMQLRENGSGLYMTSYDGENNFVQSISWGYLTFLAEGATVITVPALLPERIMLDALSFAGSDSVKGFLPGGRSATITLELKNGVTFGISLPQATEDDSTVYEVSDIWKGHVWVQPHSPRVNGIEHFVFSEYHQHGLNESFRVGDSTYEKCLANTVIFRPQYDPHYSTEVSENLHTGSFPCRWYFKNEETDTPLLVNGLFLNQQYLASDWNFTPYEAYSLESALPYSYMNGYLRIDMKCHNFARGFMISDSDKLHFGDFTTIYQTKPQTSMQVMLTWGTKVWNGTSWEEKSDSLPWFSIGFDGANLVTNKTSEIHAREDDGWFVPITEVMSGKIRFYILNSSTNYIYTDATIIRYLDNHSKIITDLRVDYTPDFDMVVSDRNSNIYRKTIMSSGFSTDISIDLDIGTMNNNMPSLAFLKSSATSYIQSMPYRTSVEGDVRDERPELHLLGRMVRYYGSVRRTLRAVVQRGIDVYKCVYIYEARRYFGILSRTDWRNDTEEVKFIEA